MNGQERAFLAGWGNTAPTPAKVVVPKGVDELAGLFNGPTPRGLIGRGLGRSYGDPAQNAGGLVVETSAVSGIRELDLERGLVTAEAGTSLDDLMRWLVPLGWFVPVTPGTRQVTVGGAIGSDVHGKNHHKVGTWCEAVEAITLVTPASGRRQITPESHPDLFWATAGGMGLTGLILDASFRLSRIETSHLIVDTDRTPDLDTTLALMEDGDDAYGYSVAWVDVMARGRSMGRSVLDRGQFAPLCQLNPRQRARPLEFRSGTFAIPSKIPIPRVINPLTVKAFNEVWYRKAPARRRDSLQTITEFFHPLDRVDSWNRCYGRSGAVQWQCALPPSAVEDLRWIFDQLSINQCPSFLSVLKRFGPGNPGPLSFPIEGWTLSIDVPTATPGLAGLLDRLDDRVVDCGGRVYLAKDSRMRPELLPIMYPRIDEWREACAQEDPERRLVSDMARRLRMLE